MALLSRNAIAKLLSERKLVIEPPPKEHDFQSDSVDAHLGNTLYTWARQAAGSTVTVALWKSIDSRSSDAFDYLEFAKQHLKVVEPDTDGIITVRPHTFYLADLLQYTKLPPDVAMHIQGKSSLARLGMQIHMTAPHAHAGWEGRLTLEMYNSGPLNIELKPGIPIGQLTFWRVEAPLDPADIPAGRFARQASATGAKADPS